MDDDELGPTLFQHFPIEPQVLLLEKPSGVSAQSLKPYLCNSRLRRSRRSNPHARTSHLL